MSDISLLYFKHVFQFERNIKGLSQSSEIHYCDLTEYIRVIKSKIMKCSGLMSRMGEWDGTYRILVGKPASRIRLGRHNPV